MVQGLPDEGLSVLPERLFWFLSAGTSVDADHGESEEILGESRHLVHLRSAATRDSLLRRLQEASPSRDGLDGSETLGSLYFLQQDPDRLGRWKRRERARQRWSLIKL